MSKVWANATEALDERRSNRNQVTLPAVLQAGQRRHAVKIVNISAHGAMVETGHDELLPGRPVTLESVGLLPTRGRIAWARDGHVGIAFVTPLAVDALLALV